MWPRCPLPLGAACGGTAEHAAAPTADAKAGEMGRWQPRAPDAKTPAIAAAAPVDFLRLPTVATVPRTGTRPLSVGMDWAAAGKVLLGCFAGARLYVSDLSSDPSFV